MHWKTAIRRYPFGFLGGFIVLLFILVGVYAPLLAAGYPLIVKFHGEIYFPIAHYAFYPGYYTKPLDLFFNLFMISLPLFLVFYRHPKKLITIFIIQWIVFFYLLHSGGKDPAYNAKFIEERRNWFESQSEQGHFPSLPKISFEKDLEWMNDYAKLNQVVDFLVKKEHDAHLRKYAKGRPITTRWSLEQAQVFNKIKNLEEALKKNQDSYLKSFFSLSIIEQNCTTSACLFSIQDEQSRVKSYEKNAAELLSLETREKWLFEESKNIDWMIMPLIRPFDWDEDAGGDQLQNQWLPWWELTRINRKDLTAALIFGVRISLVVGFLAIALACLIGIPIGAYAGYYGGNLDIIVSRLLEIWESMPTFFMLLFVVAILQSKNIFIVITVIGIFGWTTFSRYIRGEFFKQKGMAYVEASRVIGFSNQHVIFKEILPNAIPPLLTLLPFAIMGAISSEAGLSFLGLGEEGSCSWGVLMDEGRSAFPAEAYLLWPPALLLTILLVAIALVGDALRDALDPKLKR